jgi:hypothetical protein
MSPNELNAFLSSDRRTGSWEQLRPGRKKKGKLATAAVQPEYFFTMWGDISMAFEMKRLKKNRLYSHLWHKLSYSSTQTNYFKFFYKFS